MEHKNRMASQTKEMTPEDKLAYEKDVKKAVDHKAKLKKSQKKVVKKGYKVPEGEGRLFHVSMEIVRFDAKSGDRLSSPTIQKYTPQEWKMYAKTFKAQGYTIKVLHNPSKLLK